MEKQRFLIAALIVGCALSSLAGDLVPAAQETVRVSIMQQAQSFDLRVSGAYEVCDPRDGRPMHHGRNLTVTVTVSEGEVLLGTQAAGRPTLLVKVFESGFIVVNGRKFRGNVRIIGTPGAGLSVVNEIGLEDYVKGILYHEVSHHWPMEALRAQAVVCRSYAKYQMQQNKNREYDLTSDTLSQVYGGRTSERYRTNSAVDQTRAQVLVYRGRILPAYFHSTCGGRTEDASALWNVDSAPLKGVRCAYCRDSPHFAWHAVMRVEEIEEKLAQNGYPGLGAIKKIVPGVRDRSGRLKNLEIVAEKKDAMIAAKDFRAALGATLVRSTNFSLRLTNGDAVLEGYGWGHGVGMCQWGAYFMSKHGYSYQEILKYYYPGAEVATL